MIDVGKTLRLGRIFDPQTETALVVPMDHGVALYTQVLEDPRQLVRSLADAGANAFLLNRGLAKFVASEIRGRAGLILRVSCCTGFNSDATQQMVVSTVEEALRLGADAVAPSFFFGTENEPRDLRLWGLLADECDKWAMPLFPEVHPPAGEGALPHSGPYSMEAMRLCVRAAGEIGADFIKTWYSGDPQSYREVVDNSLVPILIAGGPKADTPREVLAMVNGAMAAGARGVCVGRNVFMAENPAAMLAAIAQIIRRRTSVDEALEGLRRFGTAGS